MTEEPTTDPYNRYWNGRIAVHKVEMQNTKLMRAFAKWWFDLIKNFAVVVGLGALSKKSHSTIVTALYVISFMQIVVYCTSYLQGFYFVPITSRPKWLQWTSYLVFGTIFGLAFNYANVLVFRIINELISAQK